MGNCYKRQSFSPINAEHPSSRIHVVVNYPNSIFDLFQTKKILKKIGKPVPKLDTRKIGQWKLIRLYTNEQNDIRTNLDEFFADKIVLESMANQTNPNFHHSVDEERTLYMLCLYISEEEKYSIDRRFVSSLHRKKRDVTHIISSKIIGLKILFAFHNISNETAHSIQDALFKYFENLPPDFAFSNEFEDAINQCKDQKVYVNLSMGQSEFPSVVEFLKMMDQWQNERINHSHILSLLTTVDSVLQEQQSTETNKQFDLIDRILFQISRDIACADRLIEEMKNSGPSDFINTTNQAAEKRQIIPREKLDEIINDYKNDQRALHTILDQMDAKNPLSRNKITKQLNDLHKSFDLETVKSAHKEFITAVEKVKLIERFNQDHIEYVDASNLELPQDIACDSLQMRELLEGRFSRDDENVIVWCSCDPLKQKDPEEWNQKYLLLTSKKRDPEFYLIYLDFTSNRRKLQHNIIIEMKKRVRGRNINVLLIGETGVGKSTFINAFVNYLAYQTLDEAEQNGIIAVLPASFLITTGHDFDEVTVNIGDPDPNEDFNERGASVTQHCRSYIIRLRSGLHLRLIDTPGMGDTRGVEQDMKNIDHILSYVDQFTHLDAVCFLLKPNTARMTIFFRFCLQQLLTYLTPQAYENIIFCFTNTRSTFYAPGDTGRLLRTALADNNLTAVRFEKRNTFCFDSESFRYLAMLKQNIQVDYLEREDFIQCWSRSSEESMKLLRSIQQRNPYNLSQWQSMTKVALKIQTMVRPLIETLRLMIYNLILRENGTVDRRITLDVSPMDQILCFKCADKIYQDVGPFKIIQYAVGNQIRHDDPCEHANNDDCLMIEYNVIYRYSPAKVSKNENELEHFESCLCQFDQFYRKHALRPNLNPFDEPFENVINDEIINPKVHSILTRINENRQKNLDDRVADEMNNETMETINELLLKPDVKNQMEMIKKYRQRRFETYERQVSIKIRNQDALT